VCPQVARLAKAKGNVPEPQWWQGMIGVLQYVERGEHWTHKFSSGHPTYSFDETQGRIERWREKTDGPARCASIETACGSFGAICRQCPYRVQDSNPIQIARNRAAPA